jgi:hypothetical protein
MKDRRRKIRGYHLPGAKVAFVPVAGGLWFRVHPCVLFVVCPNCKAKPCEPCVNQGQPVSWSHSVRRTEMAKQGRKVANVVVAETAIR